MIIVSPPYELSQKVRIEINVSQNMSQTGLAETKVKNCCVVLSELLKPFTVTAVEMRCCHGTFAESWSCPGGRPRAQVPPSVVKGES